MDNYIKYSSTRGGDDSLSYEEVLLAGLARDGGLFMPDYWPAVDLEHLKNCNTFIDVAKHIVPLFTDSSLFSKAFSFSIFLSSSKRIKWLLVRYFFPNLINGLMPSWLYTIFSSLLSSTVITFFSFELFVLLVSVFPTIFIGFKVGNKINLRLNNIIFERFIYMFILISSLIMLIDILYI